VAPMLARLRAQARTWEINGHLVRDRACSDDWEKSPRPRWILSPKGGQWGSA
jgi:hypothetical protein